ncbi:trigger factor [Agitococcus lubricus]|uniref:Trigger factor n=1 Tax=Agitococcus lubricus TaxID=1077255 RepID=A0A2T5IZR1_9GAMM|nr:trigger factor [Agitococcus lubricus]PTQ89523.1 trigger factor [Agitococcus lubricus]
MQVSVENVSGLERRLKISVPATQVEQAVSKKINQTARTIKIDGFRPGKVPLNIVKQRYGASIRAEALDDIIRDSYVAAVEQSQLKVAGYPNIEPISFAEGKDVEFAAVVEVYPEVTVADFASLTVERPSSEVTDADVTKMIENLRRQRAKWEDSSEAAAEQDRLVIDFEGSVAGETFEGGTAKDFSITIGANRMIPGFEEQLVGTKTGDETTITVTFPADYQAANLAGKEAQFKIAVKKVTKAVLPELDAQFLEAFGVKDGNVEQFQSDVRKNMERELRNGVRAKVKGAVFEALVAANQIDLPKALVADEIGRQRQQAIQQFGGKAANIKAEMLPDELFAENSRRSVALGLLVSDIIVKNELKLDAERVRSFVEEIAQSYEQPAEVVQWYYSNKQQMAQIESAVLEDQVVDLILAKAQITDKAVSYEELLRPQQ